MIGNFHPGSEAALAADGWMRVQLHWIAITVAAAAIIAALALLWGIWWLW